MLEFNLDRQSDLTADLQQGDGMEAVLRQGERMEAELQPDERMDAVLGQFRTLAAVKSPYIGENGNWYVWQDGHFVDSGISTYYTVDQNSKRRVKVWFGTIAEYNALQHIDPDTYYNIVEG